MQTNVLYYGDNLEILRKYILDNSIDMIYLDPPFNSKATYNILFKEPTGEPSVAQITAFEDTWHWTIETEKTFEEIVEIAPSKVVDLMLALKNAFTKSDMMAYLTMMNIRLLELHRVLKDTGSILLHCDPTASHYLKIIMDSIFDVKNFRNEIVWPYRTGGAPSKGPHFARKHDTILFYSKTDKIKFNKLKERVYYEKPFFNPEQDEQGRYYADVILRDVFEGKMNIVINNKIQEINVKPVINVSSERLDYPTQKPEGLIQLIMLATTKPNDIVMDPFCGCGSLIASAYKSNRQFIGIDITHLAISVMKWRLKHDFPNIQFKVIGEPTDLSGAIELSTQNRYQFQWWALSLIGARPYGNKKKGADTGIDGYYYFNDGGKTRKSIVQIKSGGVNVSHIRDLNAVIDREKASMGFFITLEDPTKPMFKEATEKGLYIDVFGNKYQKVQILTIDEIINNNKKPDTPQKIPIRQKAVKKSG